MKKFSTIYIVIAVLFVLVSCGGGGTGDITSADIPSETEALGDTFDVSSEYTETEEYPSETDTVTESETETETETETAPPECKATLSSVALKAEDNFGFGDDAEVEITDAEVRITVSLIASMDVLRSVLLHVEAENGEYSLKTDENGKTDISSDNCVITVTDADGISREYAVIVEYRSLGLPVVSIDTGGREITSTEEYIDATVEIMCEGIEDGHLPEGYESLEKTSVRIRGRGHSTWQMPKKPYKLKFDEKTSVLGLEKAKDWVLIANYADMSLMRNIVAYETSRVADKMGFTPTQYPVNLFYNGKYVGVYSIGDQIEVKKGRVELSDDTGGADTSFLLEVGGTETSDLIGVTGFHSACFRWCAVKYPKEEYLTEEQLGFIKKYIKEADAAVSAGVGYDEYIDVEALADWLIIHELFYNLESCFRRSCYATKEAGGLLKMGPVWDFDLAMGNLYNDFGDYRSWMCLSQKHEYIDDNWLCDLMYNDEFRALLRKRWDEIKDELLETATETADYMSELIAPSAEYNFEVWDTLGTRCVRQLPKSVTKLDTYEKHTDYVRSFIVDRWNWLDKNI